MSIHKKRRPLILITKLTKERQALKIEGVCDVTFNELKDIVELALTGAFWRFCEERIENFKS